MMAPYLVHSQSYWRNNLPKPLSDFEAVNLQMNPPRVEFDNESDPSSTQITVDSANKQGCLLQVVQLLTDLDLVISKAHISSDGGWFVDVFHITDQNGAKLTDPKIMNYIQQHLGAEKPATSVGELQPSAQGRALAIDTARLKHVGLELSGIDRPGLLHDLASDISAMGCSVLAAEVWTHNGRVAFVIYVAEASGAPVADPGMLSTMKERLKAIMVHREGPEDSPRAKLVDTRIHSGRRMHQMMFADRDFDTAAEWDAEERCLAPLRPTVSVRNNTELGYSIVNVNCADRAKLLFDTVCTLTDMQYVIHHATINTDNGLAMQEYYLRSNDGGLLDSEAERERLVKCLKAAIQRHTPAGTCLELCASDRVGLLADVTSVFLEKGISIAAATVSTRSGKAVNEFYVVDENGGPVDRRVLETVQKQIGPGLLAIRTPSNSLPGSPARELAPSSSFSLASMIRVQSERLLASLGLAPSAPQPSTSLPY